jgi:hypothetical protein
MKKIIKLTEQDLEKIVKKVLIEQKENLNPKRLKFGDRGDDVKILQQKLMDGGLLKTRSMKPTGYFGNLTKKALEKAEGVKNKTTKSNKIEPDKNEPQSNLCPSIANSKNIRNFEKDFEAWKRAYPNMDTVKLIDRIVDRDAKTYINNGIRQRAACQVAFTTARPQFDSKYLFVVDTNEKLVYLFEPQTNPKLARKLLAKDFIISGKQKQSQDVKNIAENLKLGRVKARDAGYVEGKDGMYTNPKYPGQKFKLFDVLTKENFRFLPAGNYEIQSVGDIGGSYSEQGKGGNIAGLETLEGNPLSQALHSIYTGDNRGEAARQAEIILKNPNDPAQIDKFVEIVKKGGVNLNWSYGCINFPARFLPYFRKYAENAVLVNLSENLGNYLVQNTNNYLNKMGKGEGCPSPSSLGASDLMA